MKVKFGEKSWRPEVNLQVSVVALAVGDHELALKCALAAEQALLQRGRLPAHDAKYLSYYAVMISRLARQKMGEKTVHPTFAYPQLSDGEMNQVHQRWRQKFPLTKVAPSDVA